MRTQVAIVGGGPAGLVLSHLLAREGIESVVLEHRSREYVEWRQRAGGLEPRTVDILESLGVAEVDERLRTAREWREKYAALLPPGGGFILRFDGTDHAVPVEELAGRTMTGYAQQDIVKDLIAARLRTGGEILFEVEDVTLHDLTTEKPTVRFRHEGRDVELSCDLVAGCDGFHGVSRPSIPDGVLTAYEHEYPYAWLAVTADVVPTKPRAIYSYHERGFAMHSIRAPKQTRLYLQVDRRDPLEDWPDERIWSELHLRLETDVEYELEEGPIVQKQMAPLRSFVVDPMQYGRLFLAGDAAHIVPPTGAKGLNLAVADIEVLGHAMAEWFASGDKTLLDAYSATCLRRVWRVQDFSTWLTGLLHRSWDDPSGFEHKLRISRLEHVVKNESAARNLAENYMGLVEV